MNGVALAADPPEFVSVTGPVVAPNGTVVVTVVAVTALMIEAAPLKKTLLSDGVIVLKLIPVIVTAVPIVPFPGERLLIDGGGLTIKL